MRAAETNSTTSLRALLAIMVAAAAFMIVVLGVVNAIGLQQARSTIARALMAKDVTADIPPPPLYLVEARLTLSMFSDGSLDLAAAQAALDRLSEACRSRVEYWEKAALPSTLRAQLLGEQHQTARHFFVAARKVLAAGSNKVAVAEALGAANAAYLAHRASVDPTVTLAESFSNQAIAEEQEGQRALIARVAVLFAAALVMLGGLGVWVIRRVFRATGGEPAQVREVAVAGGDLGIQVQVRPGDRTSVMAAMARLQEGLAALIGRVREASGVVARGSEELTAGSKELSTRAHEQVRRLEQTTAALHKVTAGIQMASNSAEQGASTVLAARAAVLESAEAVKQVMVKMSEIELRTRTVVEAAEMIDGFALQTSILALNAAVEAARAGAAGRGFGVVASEVRALAQQSAQTAREIRALLVAASEEVQAGGVLAARARDTMNCVVTTVNHVTDLVGQVNVPAQEQAVGANSVRDAMNELNAATMGNAAMAEQSATIANGLRQQAGSLFSALSVFKLAGPPQTLQRE